MPFSLKIPKLHAEDKDKKSAFLINMGKNIFFNWVAICAEFNKLGLLKICVLDIVLAEKA
ncbi:MAG: hypothetical protein WD038_07645 [Balneolales bacterium]